LPNCSGCGGRGHSPGGSFGHILGCGTPDGDLDKGGKYEYWNPLAIPEQRGLLMAALLASFGPEYGGKAKSDVFAKNLESVLVQHKSCAKLPCKHSVP